MQLAAERNEIVRFGKKLIDAELTTGTSGNLSIANRRQNLVAISPTGIDYFDTTSEDVVVTDMAGNIKDGHRKPSSELLFHLALYEVRPDIRAIVHTHSVYATTIACLNWELPAVHYAIGASGNKVPLAPYATYGTKDLARNIATSIGDYNAVFLANHGLVTVGPDMAAAFARAENIEFVSRVYYQARSIGEPVILSDQEMATVIDKFKTYGQ